MELPSVYPYSRLCRVETVDPEEQPIKLHSQSTLADFWQTFHHDGKISPGTHTPFHSIYHHVQSCSARYASAERADTLPLFHLYPYVLCGLDSGKNGKGRVHNEDNEAETVGAMGL
jgi:hypothetical protein